MRMMELISTHHADTHSDSSDWVRHRDFSSVSERWLSGFESSREIPCLDFVNDVRSRHMPDEPGLRGTPYVRFGLQNAKSNAAIG
jgi:hypothetical protein